MIAVERFSTKEGIVGGHNSEAFYEAIKQYDIKIISETQTGIKGISHIKYMTPIKDEFNNIIDYRGMKQDIPFSKTIYDPNIISDEKIIELGQRAAADGYQEAINKGLHAFNREAEGISFRIYLDSTTGEIRNFHPRFN